MKYCSRPFNFMWITKTFNDREEPLALPCSWMTINYADDTNLVNYSMDEVWNSATFNKVRESIKDGSFRYCNCRTCPFISNDTLEELEEKNFIEKTQPNLYPTHYDLAYDRSCNHACPSCRNRLYVNTEKNKCDVQIMNEKLLPYLNKAEVISSNGQGDFFASAENMKLFKKLKPENPNLKISIETNGVLFDKVHWNEISHLSKYSISVFITPSSFVKSTYIYLNGGFDNLKKLEDNLLFIKKLREENLIKKFTLITVIQDVNVKEISSFIRISFDKYHVDEVITRPIYKWNFLSDEDYWFKNVSNPLHPYYLYYKELLESDIMKDSRVYNWDGTNSCLPQKHPAYFYKDMAQILTKIISINCIEKKIEAYFVNNNIFELFLYGTDFLGQAMLSVLEKTKLKIKAVLCKENYMNYIYNSNDTILITNYYYKEAITRDLGFIGFKGTFLFIDQITNEMISK